MKTLVITGTTEPNSGLGRYSRQIIQGLRERGEDILVLAGAGERDSAIELNSRLSSFVKNIYRARREARKVDQVHAFDAWPFSIYAYGAVLGTGKPLYINGVGTYSIPPEKTSIKRFLMLHAYKYARKIPCISTYTMKRIQERLPFPIAASVIHLATTRLGMPDPRVVSDIRAQYMVPESAKIILTVGEIKDRKGQLDTLRAVLSLRKKRLNTIYVLVGGANDIEYIDKIKKESAEDESAYRIISNASSDKQLAAWYSMADVFALASNNSGDHFEGFGLVFLEAAQFGVPGVGTRGCGIEDAIQDGYSGILVPQRDPAAIANAIEEILSNRERFSKGALTFSSGFSWSKTIDGYLDLYYN